MKFEQAAETIQSTPGLPEGDTYIEINTTDFEPYTFTDKVTNKPITRYKATLPTGKVYSLPYNVMKEIKNHVTKGAKFVRVTRSGADLKTRYTVTPVEHA